MSIYGIGTLGGGIVSELGIAVEVRRLVDQAALVKFLQSASNFGPHYSAAPA